jgi:hypothetical protein
LLKDAHDLHLLRLEELRRGIAIGIEQADRGEVAPLDMQAILARSRERLEAQGNHAHAPSPAHQPS